MSSQQPPVDTRWLWRVAQMLTIWSGTGFALAANGNRGLIDMGVGVGIWAAIVTITAITFDILGTRNRNRP